MNKATLAVLLGCLTVIAACTKEVPYKADDAKVEFQNEILQRDLVDEKADHLYAASALEASRYTADGRPFQFGDNKRVRLEWTEKSLRVMEKERDQRFANSINDKMILEIPVEYIDFECAKDAYGDCTNTEVQKKVNWSKKAFFKIKAAEAKQGAIEVLPILLDQAFGSECYKETSSLVESAEVTADAINLKVRRNYLQSLDCMKEVDNSLSETNVSAVFNYSIVKASSVLSKDFKPISYPKLDQDTFGFFSSTYKQRDVDLNQVEKSEQTVMNHWNPNRRTIDFHLSDTFNKPQNAKLKELSYVAVTKMNEGLAKAGAKFQITLHEPSGKNPGDIRNSMIVLVEDPYESAPLGYGPQTEDPVTGEIISARTIMYSAGLLQYVKMNYDDIGRAFKRAQLKAAQQATAVVADENAEEGNELIIEEGDGSTSKTINLKLSDRKVQKLDKVISRKKIASGKLISLEKERLAIKNYTSKINDEYSKKDAKSYIKYLTEAKNCAYKVEPSTALSEVRPELMKQITDKYAVGSELRPWTSLSADEKQELMNLLIAEVYVPVLLHELGHNMGLRHNFEGSEDKENWFSKEELQAQGVNHEIPYSTIMEYGDDLRTLPFLGKYDVAALKYAYARKVAVNREGQVEEVTVDTDLIGLNKSLAQQAAAQKKEKATLVPFGFCTDEHVGPNPGCRRFDEGTTYSEMADYLIASYLERYQIRNTRSGRENFSASEDVSYAVRQYGRFMEMRNFTEIYERIKHIYGISDEEFASPQNPDWVKDLASATMKVNRLLIDVIKTPDLHCAIGNKDGKELGILPLAVIDPNAFDCSKANYDIRFFKKEFKTIGQTGRALNNKKSPDNENSYIDQIDVRGFYLDKWAAAQVLFKRNISPSFNQNLDNAWDISTLKPEIVEMLMSMLENKSISEEIFTMVDGTEQKKIMRVDYHVGAMVNQPIYAGIANALGFRNANVYLSEIISGIAVKEATTNTDNLENGAELRDFVALKRVSNFNDQTPPGFLSLTVGSEVIYAAEQNVIAQNLLLDIVVKRQLGTLKPAEIAKLNTLLKAAMKEGGTPLTMEVLVKEIPALTESQKSFIAKSLIATAELLAEKVNDMASGLMMDEAEIVKVLFTLPVR